LGPSPGRPRQCGDAVARHWDEKAMQTHRAMGFEQGWGAVADQLAELAETNN
jgi:uncharacterized protein YndB with AHSA1/START domain